MTDQLKNKEKKIVDYICNKIECKNKMYFKSKNIANDLQLTSHEVGSNLRKIKQKSQYSLKITKFSNNTPTTWKIVSTST